MPRITRSTLVLGGAAAFTALLLAACGNGSSGTNTTPAAAARTTDIATSHTDVGTVLADSRGRTLYAFAADSKGRSNCAGSCLTYWPAVRVGAQPPTLGSGVTARLGVLHRSDGTAQLTINGWPMYTYVGDSSKGAATGQGKNLSGGLWWVVSPSGTWIKTMAKTGGGMAGY